jgi:hypothetical protein
MVLNSLGLNRQQLIVLGLLVGTNYKRESEESGPARRSSLSKRNERCER